MATTKAVFDLHGIGQCRVFNASSAAGANQFLSSMGESCSIFKFFNNNQYQFELDSNYHYTIGLWGASGATSQFSTYLTNDPGLGGFVSGDLKLNTKTQFYLYVGGRGTAAYSAPVGGAGGYNGGVKGGDDTVTQPVGDCSSGGSGGATDLRLLPVSSGNAASLRSRVLVAGGGGSSGCSINGYHNNSWCCIGGNAGGISGEQGTFGHNKGTLVAGGKGGAAGAGFSFGVGLVGQNGNEAGGSGGGGYFGGFGGLGGHDSWALSTGGSGGGGGSSYISGFPGCNTVGNTGTLLGHEFHPSGIVFENGKMIKGNQTMPSAGFNMGSEIGHVGNGEAIIIKRLKFTKTQNRFNSQFSWFHALFALVYTK